jgi:hypothetical protein
MIESSDDKQAKPDSQQRVSLSALNTTAPWWLSAIIIPLTAWIWGVHKERVAAVEADARYKITTSQASTQLVVTVFPYLADTDPSGIKRDLALALLQQMARDRTLAPELEASVRAILSNLTSKVEQNTATAAEVHTLTEYAKRQDDPTLSSAASDAGTTPSPPPPPLALSAAPLPPRVYIQIFGQKDEALASKAKEVLKSAGALVPHIEDVEQNAVNGKRVPIGYEKPTLVYFNDADRSRALAIADALKGAGIGEIIVPGEANKRFKVPIGQLELWFARGDANSHPG